MKDGPFFSNKPRRMHATTKATQWELSATQHDKDVNGEWR